MGQNLFLTKVYGVIAKNFDLKIEEVKPGIKIGDYLKKYDFNMGANLISHFEIELKIKIDAGKFLKLITVEEIIDMIIYEKIVSILMEQLGLTRKEISPEDNLSDDFGIDLRDIVEIQDEIEKKFNVSIEEDEDIQNAQTVADICNTVRKVLKEN